MQSIRIFFEKTDRAKYISHLNMTTLWARVIRRAGIKMWYTEGFHPHMYMTFALPLSLGIESVCESVDMRLMEDISLNELMDKLNNALPSGIKIYKIAEPLYNPKLIKFAEYKVTLYNAEESLKAFKRFMAQDNIPAVKKGKAGERTVNLRDYIFGYSAESIDGNLVLKLKLASGNVNTLNPQLSIDTFATQNDVKTDEMSIVRTAIFKDDGNIFE